MTILQLPVPTLSDSFRVFRLNIRKLDLMLMVYHLIIMCTAFSFRLGDDAVLIRVWAAALFISSLSGTYCVRGGLLREGKFRAVFYRVVLLVTTVYSYFLLGLLLPSLGATLMDHRLLAIDHAMFGDTPARWLAQFASETTCGWFSFFYYAYFWLLVVTIIPTMILGQSRPAIELIFGVCAITSIGHLGYLLVPGLGPVTTVAFESQIPGSFFWNLVQEMISSLGSKRDIFPSLHTAHPFFLALHAFTNRKSPPFRYYWPVMAFFSANIIIATMFLRFHYGIDVIVGMLVAVVVLGLSKIAARSDAMDTVNGRQAVLEPIAGDRRPSVAPLDELLNAQDAGL